MVAKRKAGPMDVRDYIFDGKRKFKLKDVPTNLKVPQEEREHYLKMTEENVLKMAALQDRLYADGREGVVILFQAMDAAGKDSTIKGVMSGLNPQGVVVHSFKQPSSLELSHDYLWRACLALPPRGYIGLFNRSYYEDVLVARVHGLERTYKMSARCTEMGSEQFYDLRYRQIADFERYLFENGYRFLKVMLNVSMKEQRKRFLERIDNETKNWKFSASDLEERALFDEYMDAYQTAIERTARTWAPWMVVPADQKWVMRYLVSEAIVGVLEACDPQYPTMPADQVARLGECRERLMAEKA